MAVESHMNSPAGVCTTGTPPRPQPGACAGGGYTRPVDGGMERRGLGGIGFCTQSRRGGGGGSGAVLGGLVEGGGAGWGVMELNLWRVYPERQLHYRPR